MSISMDKSIEDDSDDIKDIYFKTDNIARD